MRVEIGHKIKELRLAAELTQEELGTRAQLTKGFISQLENDQSSISVDSLLELLDALGISISQFFEDDTETDRIQFGPADRLLLNDRGAKNFEMLIPGSTNMLMDPISITLFPGESLEFEEPHNGEEFGYVLSGRLTIKYGSRTIAIKKDECFYFESSKPHQFSNNGKNKTTIIWVTTPPQM